MELASYLAGERCSDHPACTHPLLAAIARLVNDHTSDKGRPRLAELIPSVIGLTGDDPHIDALITLRCTTIALPVTKERTQAVVDATTRGWPGVNDAQWGLLRHPASKGLGVQSPWLHAVMSRGHR